MLRLEIYYRMEELTSSQQDSSVNQAKGKCTGHTIKLQEETWPMIQKKKHSMVSHLTDAIHGLMLHYCTPKFTYHSFSKPCTSDSKQNPCITVLCSPRWTVTGTLAMYIGMELKLFVRCYKHPACDCMTWAWGTGALSW